MPFCCPTALPRVVTVTHRRRALGLLLLATSVAASPAAPAGADVVDDAPSCAISGFSPRSASVGLEPVTVRFRPAVSGCAPEGWSIEGGEYAFYAHDTAEEVAFAPVGNGETAPSDVVVSVYDATHIEQERHFPGAFVLKRATAWNRFNAAPEPVRRGAKITIKGQLTRVDWATRSYVGRSGRAVSVQFRTKTGTYHSVKTVTTGSDGHVATTVTASADGYWRLRYAGDSTSGASTVAGDFVDVR